MKWSIIDPVTHERIRVINVTNKLKINNTDIFNPTSLSLSERKKLGLYEYQERNLPGKFQWSSGKERSLDHTNLLDIDTHTLIYKDKDVILDAKLRELSDFRWQVETGGCVVGNMQFDTQDRAKSLLNGAYSQALLQDDPTLTRQWKTDDGWVTVTNADIIASASAVASFVQSCFDSEKTHYDQLKSLYDNDDVEGIISYNFKSANGWPANASYFS